MNSIKRLSIACAMVAITALAACGNSSYASNDIYSSGYGLTYYDACQIGLRDACFGLYGRNYYDQGHPGYRRTQIRTLTPATLNSYEQTHPTMRQRVAATKQRVVVDAKRKAAAVKAKARAAKAKASQRKSSIFQKAKSSTSRSFSRPSFRSSSSRR